MNKERKKYIESCEISELTEVVLCGYKQKILIEAHTKGLPVVLFLHGGPGFPVPFCVGARGLFPKITKQFTAVYWDQLGCGINNRKIDDSFTTKKFADMTVELVRYLKGRFPAQPLYLFGISWGSLLSAYTAVRVPELIAGVVSAGQIVLAPMLSDEAFGAIAKSSAPQKVKEKIAAMRGKKPGMKEIALLSKTLRKYTSAYGINDKSSNVENPMKEIFASKDYRLKDKLACFSNGYRKNGSLLRELSKIDLTDVLASVTVPYSVFAGDRDLVTPAREVQEAAKKAGNPLLTVTVLKGEGHIPTDRACKEIFAKLGQMNA